MNQSFMLIPIFFLVIISTVSFAYADMIFGVKSCGTNSCRVDSEHKGDSFSPSAIFIIEDNKLVHFNDISLGSHFELIDVDGLAISTQGTIYGFEIQQTGNGSPETINSRLIEFRPIDFTAPFAYVDPLGDYLQERNIRGAMIDQFDNLWAVDTTNSQLLQINPNNGEILSPFNLHNNDDQQTRYNITSTSLDLTILANGQMLYVERNEFFVLHIDTDSQMVILEHIFTDEEQKKRGQNEAPINYIGAASSEEGRLYLFDNAILRTDIYFFSDLNNNSTRTFIPNIGNIPCINGLSDCTGNEFISGRGDLAILETAVDTIPPVIMTPTDITANATDSDGAIITYMATAIDDVDGPIPTTCTPSSGSLFPIGETTVTCTAEDAAGNSAIPRSFTVTVLEITFCGKTINDPFWNDVIDNRGNSAAVLRGTSGPDLFLAGYNGDTFDGKKGDDCIIGGNGNDELIGGGGDDIINGGNGDDTIKGSTGNDAINGDDGNDIVIGNKGNDTINGGHGNDTLAGGGGDDTINGNEGLDTISGHSGNDVLVGGLDNDVIYGNSGSDVINGGLGNDLILGGRDDDTINGDDGNDTILGNSGNDNIFGNNGNDVLLGEKGNDTIDGGENFDVCIDGSGTNISVVSCEINQVDT